MFRRIITLILWIFLAAGIARGAAPVASSDSADLAPPRIFPDYAGVTIPPNIAPMNFRLEEKGAKFQVEFRSTKGEPILLKTKRGAVSIPIEAWRKLLRANCGEELLHQHLG